MWINSLDYSVVVWQGSWWSVGSLLEEKLTAGCKDK